MNPAMIADLVILDGEMTAKLPAHVAASTGADALCHAVECYTSNKATAFSNLFALEALKLIFAHLEAACLDRTHTRPRTPCCWRRTTAAWRSPPRAPRRCTR